MTPLDSLALIGEILSWIGLGLGLPLLLAAVVIRAGSGDWEPVEIAVIRTDGVLRARWFAGGDFRERPLRAAESGIGEGWHAGYVSSRRPGRVRFVEPPPTARICSLTGGILSGAGVLGFIVSWLPALI